MSATNRGGTRREADFYETPSWVTHRLLEKIVGELPGGSWLEPACGHGSIIRSVNQYFPLRWDAFDIRNTQVEMIDIQNMSFFNRSFLDEPVDASKYNVIITNPPYSLAIDFIKKSFEYRAHIIMLLRANFIASGTRHPFMSRHMPDVYMIPNRPSFTDNNKTDACEYAWFKWGPTNRERTVGNIYLLDITPANVRRFKRGGT